MTPLCDFLAACRRVGFVLVPKEGEKQVSTPAEDLETTNRPCRQIDDAPRRRQRFHVRARRRATIMMATLFPSTSLQNGQAIVKPTRPTLQATAYKSLSCRLLCIGGNMSINGLSFPGTDLLSSTVMGTIGRRNWCPLSKVTSSRAALAGKIRKPVGHGHTHTTLANCSVAHATFRV